MRRGRPLSVLKYSPMCSFTGIHPSGAGIARLSDNSKSKDVPEILVPGALPGARGDLFWNPPKPGGHWGLAVEWRESAPSPDADPSRCPHAASLNGQPVCGGCPLGSLKYSAELALKTKLLIEEPLRQAGLWREGLIQPPSGQPEAFAQHFRNKAVLYPSVINGIGRFGYYAARSQILVPAEDCPQNARLDGRSGSNTCAVSQRTGTYACSRSRSIQRHWGASQPPSS